MIGLTDYITESLWEDIFTLWYVLIDDAYQHLIACLGRRLRQRGPEPTFSDSEVITVAMITVKVFRSRRFLVETKNWVWPFCVNIIVTCFPHKGLYGGC